MSITIGSNIASLKAQRQLETGTNALGKVFERLASGQRINKASDDAAGLAVATSLAVESRLYTRAIANINDAISSLSIADSTITALQEIVTRQLELAEQAASGQYSARQRESMHNEAGQLVDEYNRIGSTTKFNSNSLIGSHTTYQIGPKGSDYLELGIATELAQVHGDGTFTAMNSLIANSGLTPLALGVADLNNDQVADIVIGNSNSYAIIMSNGDGTFKAAQSYQGLISVSGTIAIKDVNGDGKNDLLMRGTPAGLGVLLGNGNGTFLAPRAYSVGSIASFALADLNGDGVSDFVGGHSSFSAINVAFGNSDGSFNASSSIAAITPFNEPRLGDFDGDGDIDFVLRASTSRIVSFVNDGQGNFTTTNTNYVPGDTAYSLADVDRNGYADLIFKNSTNTIGIALGNGDGTFRNPQSSISLGQNSQSRLEINDFNGDGYIDIVAETLNVADVPDSILLGNGDGSFKAVSKYPVTYAPSTVAFMGVGDITGDGALDIVTLHTTDNGITFLAGSPVSDISQSRYSLRTASDARNALDSLGSQLSKLALVRGSLGAGLSRLEVIASQQTTAREVTAAAASRIMDADIANESSQLIRNKILQQAGAAVLAQANLQPQLALSLLRG